MATNTKIHSIEILTNNLKHQLSLYRQLIDLLRVEKEQIISINLKELRNSTYSKEAILDEITREEQRRKAWCAEAAQSMGVEEKIVTIEWIVAKIATGSEVDQLLSLKQALSHLVIKAREMNLENQALVKSALVDAQEMKKNILGLTTDQPKVYGKNGQLGPSSNDKNPRFLSKEA
ncbi:MAG: flagellar protein FlgN [Oligoflexia bacterium]|nr:flagellar protein FlgN [Oligoflexia bacterium]